MNNKLPWTLALVGIVVAIFLGVKVYLGSGGPADRYQFIPLDNRSSFEFTDNHAGGWLVDRKTGRVWHIGDAVRDVEGKRIGSAYERLLIDPSEP